MQTIWRVIEDHGDLDSTPDDHTQYNWRTAEGAPKYGATSLWMIPGVERVSVGTAGHSTNVIRYSPFLVTTSLTIDAFGYEVTTASSAGATFRLGIYNANTHWQPTSLVVDAGTGAADSTGVKTIVLGSPITLAPGRYLNAMLASVGGQVRVTIGGATLTGFFPTLGSSFAPGVFRVNLGAYGALGDPGTAWDTTDASGVGPVYYFHHRISSP